MKIKHPSVEEPCQGSKATAQARKRRMELRKQMRAAAAAAAAASSEKEELAHPTEPDLPPSKRLKASSSEKPKKNQDSEEDLMGAEVSLATPPKGEEGEEKAKPSITGIKKQHRYDPGVQMTRDELKAWRKEARRVRNRESAAASRKRNRDRITELEQEVRAITSKYGAALRHILRMEEGHSHAPRPSVLRQDLQETTWEASPRQAATGLPARRSLSPDTSLQDSMAQMVSPPLSPASCGASCPEGHNPMLLHVISSMDPLPPVHPYQYLPIHSSVSPSPPTTPLHEDSHSHHNTSGGDDDDDEEDPLVHSKITMTKYQHIMDMISQPAVSI